MVIVGVEAQHSVIGHFTPPEDFKMVILYKVTPNDAQYINYVYVGEEGDFTIELDSTINTGMIKLAYGLPQEENSFDFIYNAKEDIEFNFDTETGVEFLKSTENKLVASYTESMGMISQSIGNYFKEERQDTLTLKSIFDMQRNTQQNFEKAAQGTIALNFIKANSPYIPEDFEDLTTYISNLKAHYFDHVDFENQVLQSSNFLIERVLNYVYGMTNDQKEEHLVYQKNIEDLEGILKDVNPEMQLRLFEILWYQMVDVKFDSVAQYISDTRLLALAKKLNKDELVSDILEFKRTAIGVIAPDFALNEKENSQRSLHQLQNAETYVIIFWSSSCGHCLNEMPKLHEFLKVKSHNINVIAVGLEDEKSRWENEILNYPLFTHVLGLGKWENEIGNQYNIRATPEYFILDKQKKVIAKPFDVEQLKAFINANSSN